MQTTTNKRFKVGLSFAGENRGYIKQVADELINILGDRMVFYDNYFQEELARLNLDTYLQKIYLEQTDLVAVFFCENYSKKEWCGLEWRAVREMIKKKNEEEIMPFRFDDTTIDGFLSIDGYIKINGKSPKEVSELIIKRLKYNGVIKDKELKLITSEDIEIILDVDFTSFDEEKAKNFIAALSALLNDHTIILKKKKPGNSVILSIEISKTSLIKLLIAVHDPVLKEFRPKWLTKGNKTYLIERGINFPKNFDSTKGSKLWLFNHFRTQVLTALIQDLINFEQTGLSINNSEKLIQSLNYFQYSIYELPKNVLGHGLFTIPLDKQIQNFIEVIKKWCSIDNLNNDAVLNKKKAVIELRKIRIKISMASRRLQVELDSNVEESFLMQSYRTLIDFINYQEGQFINLKSALKKLENPIKIKAKQNSNYR